MIKKTAFQTIALHPEAPPKPEVGAACNGCGICCALETCPVGLMLFLQRHGPCPALRWNEAHRRYCCGLLDHPGNYLRWLPQRWHPAVSRFFAYRIATGQGCDCSAEVVRPFPDPS